MSSSAMKLEDQLSEVRISATTLCKIQMTACVCGSEFEFYFLLYSKFQLFVPEVVILTQVGTQLLAPHPSEICLQLPPPCISPHACKVFGL